MAGTTHPPVRLAAPPRRAGDRGLPHPPRAAHGRRAPPNPGEDRMSPTPTGRLFGDDLVLTRTFRAPIADVWASLTDPERTARWFGAWEGDAAPGRTIKVQMMHEEGKPWMDLTIDACEPPTHLALSAADG